MSRNTGLSAALLVLGPVTLAGCPRSPSEPAPGPSASAVASASAAPSIPHLPALSEATVTRALNPKQLPVYAGPTGVVRGIVRVVGDTAPELPEAATSIKADCDPARSMYGRLFREGEGRSLADVFVGVTGYNAFVPPREAFVTITARDCAYERRTIGVTFGQGLKVKARGVHSYIPALVGGLEGANMVAVPNGSPVTLSPMRAGRFELLDLMHPFIRADLLVVQFPTFDVTDLDGRFEVTGVPVGEVKVNALLPAAMLGAEKKVTVTQDRPAEVDLTVTFDRRAYEARAAAAASARPAASASASPTGAARPPAQPAASQRP